jgi:GDP-mannose transporter
MQAYGEVLWFGGRVTALTLVSFIFMVRNHHFKGISLGAQRSDPAQVISSLIAAWSDASQISVTGGLSSMTTVVTSLNVGYVWMLTNCLVSAAYVRRFDKQKEHGVDIVLWQVLAMRKKIKVTGFSDWDSMFYNNLLSIPVLLLFSLIVEDWSSGNLEQSLYVISVPLSLDYGILLTGPSLPM